MKIPSSDIPQADILEDVVAVVKAVGEGNIEKSDCFRTLR